MKRFIWVAFVLLMAVCVYTRAATVVDITTPPRYGASAEILLYLDETLEPEIEAGFLLSISSTDTNYIENADITADAAIELTKLEVVLPTYIIVGNSSSQAVDVVVSGDITIASGGAVTIVDNAVLASEVGAGILPSDVVYSNAAGVITVSTIEVGHASDTTLARSGAGVLTVEGNELYAAGGTDVPVADGGTGVGTFTDGGILLGSGTTAITATAVLGDGEILIGDGSADPAVLDVGSSTAITVLGTVGTGTWEATDVGVGHGGTGLSVGTSGGVLFYSATTTIASSGLLTQYGIVLGGGAGVTPATLAASANSGAPLLSAGNAANPAYGPLNLAGGATIVSGDLPVADGGTGLSSGTSGGVLAYTATGTLASSGLLAQYGPLIGGGAGVVPSTIAAGGANDVLCGAAGAAPTMRALVNADVPEDLTIAGGTVNSSIIGGSTPAAGSFTTLTADSVAFADVVTLASGLRTYLADGMLIDSTLAITAPADQFKTTSTAVYTISGVTYTKAATDTLEFTLADTINTGTTGGVFYGIWLVQINAAGDISTKAGGGLADQVYGSSELAIAALPDADALNVSLGYILVENTTDIEFICNTTVLTGLDTYSDTQIKALPAAL